MKTQRFTQLFLYCSERERSVKYVRPVLEMEARKVKQRGVVLLLVAEGAGTRSGMLSDGIIFLHDNARPYTNNLVRDKLHRFSGKHFNILRTAQIFPLVPSTFLAT